MQLNEIDCNISDFLKTGIFTHISIYFQINQIKFIDDIIKVMQLNQIDWNSSDFLKTRIFIHISSCYSKHDLSESSNGLRTIDSPSVAHSTQ